MKRFQLAVCLLFMAATGTLASAQLDNKGDDFILAFMENDIDLNAQAVELHLTSDIATNVTVQYPVVGPFITNTTVAVNPGSITIVPLPLGAANDWVADTVSNNAVRMFADDEFVAYMINRDVFTSDAALGLPIDTMNTEYIVMDYNSGGFGSQLCVYAAFDNTTVTITPTGALQGHAANVPFNVTLNRGEGYYGLSSAVNITGTTISADNPVGLTNGNYCVNVPAGVCCCDHIFEVAQAVQTWGNQVLVANLPQRTGGTIYRICASQDGTTVNQNGALLANLNAGQYFETAQITGDHVFSADKPIFVCQYMTGDLNAGADDGDPAMGNMIPCEQFQSDYTFSTVGGGQFGNNYLTIFVEDADTGTVLLDGALIGAGAFSAIAGSGFSVAVLALADGTHTTSSNGVHGITVEGYNPFNSYIYPGGALFQFINPVGDANPPICTIVDAGDQKSASGTAEDNRPSEDVNMNGVLDPGEDLNNNGQIDEDTGVFFVVLDPGSNNISLTVSPFVPGDGTVNFQIDLIDDQQPGNGVVRITDGAGNETTCAVDLLGAECFLVLGNGVGGQTFSTGGHEWTTQIESITQHFPVLLDDIPSFPLPAIASGRKASLLQPTVISEFTAQVLMWNPVDFPANPEQYTGGLLVKIWSNGRVTAKRFGSADNMDIAVETFRGVDGKRYYRLPFSINGF